MADKYAWKPGEGVRSVRDVFNLIVAENGVLARTLTGAAAGDWPAPINDPEKLQEALKTSYANVRKTIEGLSGADLKAAVKIFGKDMTKEGAIRYVFGDQHEASGAVDRLCALERRCPALVEISALIQAMVLRGPHQPSHGVRVTEANKCYSCDRVW